MLVLPSHVLSAKLVRLSKRRRRRGDLCDKVGGRGFGDAVNEDAQERYLENDEEGEGEAVEHALTVMEPELLLCGRVTDAREVGFELKGGGVCQYWRGIEPMEREGEHTSSRIKLRLPK